MSLTKSILIIIGCYIVSVVIADIAGVLLNSLIDVFAGRRKNTALYYTIWFVFAIFTGILYVGTAYDYAKKNEFVKNNKWVIVLIAIILTITAFWVFYTQGQMQNVSAKEDYYVPGNASMTYTFFSTFILASIFGWYMDRPFLASKKK